MAAPAPKPSEFLPLSFSAYKNEAFTRSALSQKRTANRRPKPRLARSQDSARGKVTAIQARSSLLTQISLYSFPHINTHHSHTSSILMYHHRNAFTTRPQNLKQLGEENQDRSTSTIPAAGEYRHIISGKPWRYCTSLLTARKTNRLGRSKLGREVTSQAQCRIPEADRFPQCSAFRTSQSRAEVRYLAEVDIHGLSKLQRTI